MTLNEWLAPRGRGALTDLHYDARVSLPTLGSARDGKAVTAEVAERISAATGGDVSVESLRYPKGRGAPDTPTNEHGRSACQDPDAGVAE